LDSNLIRMRWSEPPTSHVADESGNGPRLLVPARSSRRADNAARSLPGAPALQLIRLLERRNIASEQLLAPLGLRQEELEKPFARISIDTLRALVDRARQLTGDPGLGFYMGLETRASNFGYLGFAAMCAANVREAIELTIRFVPILTDAFDLRLKIEGGRASLEFESHVDFGSLEDVFMFGAVVGLWQIASACTGTPVTGLTELTFPEPSYYGSFEHLLPRARFGQPTTRLVFDASVLALPIVGADRAALRLAREQCQAVLEALDRTGGVVDRVRRLVARAGDAPLSIARAAAALDVSPRTLKRKLAAEGISFSQLVAERRREAALLLLKTSSLSLDAIAERLGYSTAPNFIRAFRRWTGATPLAYRRSSR
jgi:AraC-like DNA-binding protein